MVSNPFTLKSIRGVFEKIPIAIQKSREERKEEKRVDYLQAKQDQKAFVHSHNQYEVDEAREHAKEKAREIISNPKLPLAKKLEAINELHKPTKPKLNPIIQEISDKAYINRFNRDKRFSRVKMVKQVLNEHKENQLRERNERMNQVSERNRINQVNNKASLLIQQTKMRLR